MTGRHVSHPLAGRKSPRLQHAATMQTWPAELRLLLAVLLNAAGATPIWAPLAWTAGPATFGAFPAAWSSDETAQPGVACANTSPSKKVGELQSVWRTRWR